jgi:hypothetical protein
MTKGNKEMKVASTGPDHLCPKCGKLAPTTYDTILDRWELICDCGHKEVIDYLPGLRNETKEAKVVNNLTISVIDLGHLWRKLTAQYEGEPLPSFGEAMVLGDSVVVRIHEKLMALGIKEATAKRATATILCMALYASELHLKCP